MCLLKSLFFYARILVKDYCNWHNWAAAQLSLWILVRFKVWGGNFPNRIRQSIKANMYQGSWITCPCSSVHLRIWVWDPASSQTCGIGWILTHFFLNELAYDISFGWWNNMKLEVYFHHSNDAVRRTFYYTFYTVYHSKVYGWRPVWRFPSSSGIAAAGLSDDNGFLGSIPLRRRLQAVGWLQKGQIEFDHNILVFWIHLSPWNISKKHIKIDAITSACLACQTCHITSLFNFHKANPMQAMHLQPVAIALQHRSVLRAMIKDQLSSAWIILSFSFYYVLFFKKSQTKQKQIPWHHWLLEMTLNCEKKLMLHQALCFFYPIPSSNHLSIWINQKLANLGPPNVQEHVGDVFIAHNELLSLIGLKEARVLKRWQIGCLFSHRNIYHFSIQWVQKIFLYSLFLHIYIS